MEGDRSKLGRVGWIAVALGTGGCDGLADAWDRVEGLPQTSQLNAVWASGSNDVWVAADSGRMLHFDGDTWESIELGHQSTILDIWGFAPNDLWAVGGTTLARWDGSQWEITDLSQENAGISGVARVWGTGPDDVWVSGEQSTAAHFDGTTWTRHIAAGTENTALWGTAADDVWVGGTFEVARWDGAQWNAVEDSVYGASAIWGSGRHDVWIADDSDLAHFDGNGWTTSELDGLAGITAMWGSGPDDIWGVGDFGSIVHFDGDDWREVQSQPLGSPYLRSFLDVHGSSSEDVWAVGVQYGTDGITPQIFRYSP